MKSRVILPLILISLAGSGPAQDSPQHDSPQDVPQRVRVASGVVSGLLQKRVNPVYPPLARQARIQGTVILQARINKEGDIADLQLISGHPMLAPAAIEAVRQWKYRPYLLNGDPVTVETQIQVNFVLSGEPPSAGVAGDAPGAALPENDERTFEGFPGVRVAEGVMRERRTEKIDPIYPPTALQDRIQGTVAIVIQVSASGEVNKIALVSGHPQLAPAAIDAVKQWKYRPFTSNNVPVEVATIVRLNFTISSSGEGTVADVFPVPGTAGVISGIISSTPPQGAQLPHRIRVSQGVSQGLVLSKVSPQYPPEAREQRIQGTVVLQVRIDPEGNVVEVQLMSGHPALAQSAIDAVKQWKYRPYLLNNTPLEVETLVTVNFTLAE